MQRRSCLSPTEFRGSVFAPSLSSWQGQARSRIPSGVRCLSRDCYPRGTVVGAVINVDSVAAGVLSGPVDVSVLTDRPDFSAVRPEKREEWSALHSEVGVALVCDGPIALQQNLHPALSGREIIDMPRIA